MKVININSFLKIKLFKFSININGIPSKCLANCNFQWSNDLTPIVNTIDTTNPLSIKLTGSGFDANILSNNLVTIGNTSCVISSATATILYCSPDQGPVGTFNFKLKVLPNGLATMNSAATFSFSLKAEIIPTTSGTGGKV